jgi:hypothetical protein
MLVNKKRSQKIVIKETPCKIFAGSFFIFLKKYDSFWLSEKSFEKVARIAIIKKNESMIKALRNKFPFRRPEEPSFPFRINS